MGFGEQLGMTAGTAAAGGIMGMILGGYNDERQYRQQQDLQNLQIRGQKEMTDYQMMKQMEMWKNTNYPAQLEMMKKAGLSPGLMYGKGGGGGTTTGNASGSVTGGTAPQGGREIQDMMGMGMQLQLLKAQKENIEADTELKKTESTKKGGVDTANVEASTMSILQGINNQKAQETKTNIETEILSIEKRIKEETADDAIQLASWAEQDMGNKVEQLYRQNIITKATMGEAVDQIKANLAATIIHNEMMRAQTGNIRQQTQVGIAEVKNIIQKMVLDMRKEGREVYGQNMESQKNAHDQWVNDVSKQTGVGMEVVEKVIQGIILKNIVAPGGGQPIRGFHNR